MNPLRSAVFHLLLLAGASVLEGQTPPALRADQRQEIIALKDAEAEVRGKVSRVGRGGALWFINFEGAGKDGFCAIVSQADRGKIEQAAAVPLGTLAGAELAVRGKVAIYKGQPQIQITELVQLQILTTPPPAQATVSLTDTAGLRARAGSEVVLSGTVREVVITKGGGIYIISFEGVPRGGFTAIVRSVSLPDLERAAKGNLDASLPGRRITISGKISLYKDAPQIELTKADQLKVLP